VVEEYKRSFADIHVSPEDMLFVVYILFGVVGIVLLHLLYTYLRDKVFARQAAGYAITRKSRIKSILHLAQDERKKFELRFLPPKPGRKTTSCSLLELDDALISFELPVGVRATPEWIDRSVEFFFRAPKGMARQKDLAQVMNTESRSRVKSGEGPPFYYFSDTIRSVKRFPNGQCIIQTGFPRRLIIQQKRQSLRIAPPEEYVLGCALWPDRLALTGARTTNARKWGKPAMSLTPGNPRSPFSIGNISALGMSLAISTQAARSSGLHLAIGDLLVLLFDLFDPDYAVKRRYWVQGRIQNSYEDLGAKSIVIGLLFQRAARPVSEAQPYELIWGIVDDDGLDTLGNWVMKRHLDMHRKVENPSILPKESLREKETFRPVIARKGEESTPE